MKLTTVVFDLGGVVLRWEPHRAFHGVLEPADVQPFLDEVDFRSWNRQHDAGRPFAEGVLELSERFPHHAEAIAAYPRNHHLTITGEIDATVAVIDQLRHRGVRLLALTNWSAETFPCARRRFGVLQHFEGIVVSGEEGVAKPDPRLYQVLLHRYQVQPADAVFVDDLQANVDAAIAIGMQVCVSPTPRCCAPTCVGSGCSRRPTRLASPPHAREKVRACPSRTSVCSATRYYAHRPTRSRRSTKSCGSW